MAPLLANAQSTSSLTVGNVADDGQGSLRQALRTAVAGSTITLNVSGVITNTAGQLFITNDLIIVGPGATNLAISGFGASRVFNVASNVTVSISGVTIRDGLPATGLSGGGILNFGTLKLTGCVISDNSAQAGGVLDDGILATTQKGGGGGGICNAESGILTLVNCVVSNNFAGAGGSTIDFPDGFFPTNPLGGNGGDGGGIYNAGICAITSCQFSGNSGGTGGQGTEVNQWPIGVGTDGGSGGGGGAVCNCGLLTLTSSHFYANTCGIGGLGGTGLNSEPDGTVFSISPVYGGAGGTGGEGGGILNEGIATLVNCSFARNAAGVGGGAGSGDQSTDGNGGNGGAIKNFETLDASDCKFSENLGGDAGGCSLVGQSGTGGSGGAIANAGTMTLSACDLNSNAAGSGSAGGDVVFFPVYPVPTSSPGGPGGDGGAIFNEGTAQIIRCTLSGNSGGIGGTGGPGYSSGRATGGNGGNGGNGGGVFNAGILGLSLCSLGNNHGGTGGSGGPSEVLGIPDFSPGGNGGCGGGVCNIATLVMIATTVSGNEAGPIGDGGVGMPGGNPAIAGSGGGVYSAATNAVTSFRNDLVAENIVNGGLGPDLAGNFVSQGHNLIGRSDGGTGLTNTVNFDLMGSLATPLDPMIGPLSDNGGGNLTFALMPASPAIDAGDDALEAAPFNLTVDQRGHPRKVGDQADIGAFEFDGAGRVVYPSFILPGSMLLVDGSFQFTFLADTGPAVSVLASTDLVNWGFLGLGTEISPGHFFFQDSASTNLQRNFYRISQP